VDGARQVIRWSIPGFLCMIVVASIIAGLELSWGTPASQLLGAGQIPTVLIALSPVASIPVGFVLWIVYYVGFQPTRLRFLNCWLRHPIVADDRGGRVLSGLIANSEDFFRLASSFGATRWGFWIEAATDGSRSQAADEDPATDGQGDATNSDTPESDSPTEASAHSRWSSGRRHIISYWDMSIPTSEAIGDVETGRQEPEPTYFRKTGDSPLFTVRELQFSNWRRILNPLHMLTLESTAANVTELSRKDRRRERSASLGEYRDFTRQSWALVTALINDPDGIDPQSRIQKSMDESLDIYHALGVVRTACWTSWVVSFAVVAIGRPGRLTNLTTGVILGACGALLAFLWCLAHINRRDTLLGLEAHLRMNVNRGAQKMYVTNEIGTENALPLVTQADLGGSEISDRGMQVPAWIPRDLGRPGATQYLDGSGVVKGRRAATFGRRSYDPSTEAT